jgi:hypothetical protein
MIQSVLFVRPISRGVRAIPYWLYRLEKDGTR